MYNITITAPEVPEMTMQFKERVRPMAPDSGPSNREIIVTVRVNGEVSGPLAYRSFTVAEGIIEAERLLATGFVRVQS